MSSALFDPDDFDYISFDSAFVDDAIANGSRLHASPFRPVQLQGSAAMALHFRFTLNEYPDLSFVVQQVHVPSMEADSVFQPSPLLVAPRPASHITMDNLQVTILLDEQMVVYKAMMDWMLALAPVQDVMDRTSWQADTNLPDSVDANLDVLDAQNNPIARFRFPNVFPIELGELRFMTNAHGVPVMTTTVTFAITTMEFVQISR